MSVDFSWLKYVFAFAAFGALVALAMVAALAGWTGWHVGRALYLYMGGA